MVAKFTPKQTAILEGSYETEVADVCPGWWGAGFHRLRVLRDAYPGDPSHWQEEVSSGHTRSAH